MPVVGQMVIVTDPNLDINNQEVIVTASPDELPKVYKDYRQGKDCILAEDQFSRIHILDSSQYKEKFSTVKEFKRIVFDNVGSEANPSPIKIHDVITPKERDNGTRKLFYPVVSVTDHGVSFYDDSDNKRSYTFDKVEKVNSDSLINYIVDLQNQVHELRQLVVQSLELTTDDIQRKLDEFKG